MSLGLAPLAAAFRDGSDTPVKALARCVVAADAEVADRSILWRVPAARAEADAAAATQRFAAGQPIGPLDGVPIAVKDCIDVAGLPTTNGTRYLTAPATMDAVLVERLRAAGAVLFAKTNMHEFGILPLGINPHHGTPRNPWDEKRIPGGSSSGSAVAVASGIVPIAVGTDAGGSVRIPAALNGLVGLKPTFGAVPDHGVARLTGDLDAIGPLAWTVEDATLLYEVLAGVQVARDVITPAARIGVCADWFLGAEAGVERVVREAVSACFPGAADVETPMCRWSGVVEFVIVGTDASARFAGLIGAHGQEMGADVRTVLQLGLGLDARTRTRADAMRDAIRSELRALFERCDLVVGPAVGMFAPLLHKAALASGEIDPAGTSRLSAVTFVANLAGLPSVVVPCVREGLPMGMQIMGRAGDEARVLAAAAQVEQVFGPRKPPRWHG